MHDTVCPACGYCPTCGRKNSSPRFPYAPNPYLNPYPYVYPWWQGSITIQEQGSNHFITHPNTTTTTRLT